MYMSVTSIQLLSCVRRFGTPWTAACPDSLSVTNSWSLCLLPSQFYCSSYVLFDKGDLELPMLNLPILAPLHGYTEALGSGNLLQPALRKGVVHHSC